MTDAKVQTSTQGDAQPLLITGASGFIGRHIVKTALTRGQSVTAFFRHAAAPELQALKSKWGQQLTLAQGYDLSAQSVLLSEMKSGDYGALIHCAASSVFMGGQDAASHGFPDVAALHELLDQSDQSGAMKPIVILGSAMIYGPTDAPIKETAPPQPQSLYGVNKTLCSELASFYRRIKHLPVTELRLFNIYGTGDRPPRLIPACVEAALQDEPIAITSGTQKRDFVHVDDVAAIALAATSGHLPSDIYNVATGQATAIKQVAQLIVEVAQSKSALQIGEIKPRPHDYALLSGDNGRLDAYGLAPKISLRAGLEKTIDESRGLLS